MKPFCLVPDGSFYFIRTFLHRNKYLRIHYWKNARSVTTMEVNMNDPNVFLTPAAGRYLDSHGALPNWAKPLTTFYFSNQIL